MYGSRPYVWVGKTEKEYVYDVKPFPIYLGEVRNMQGNFIFTRFEYGKGHIPIYIDCGNMRTLFINRPFLIRSIFLQGVTHIHVHNNQRKIRQREEMNDICLNLTDLSFEFRNLNTIHNFTMSGKLR